MKDDAAWQLVESQVLKELRHHFRPEFLNRVDDIVVFRPLTRAQIGQIVGLQLIHLEKLLAARELKLEVTPEARGLLAEKGYDPVYGARPLKRVIQRLLQNPIALTVLEGGYGPGDLVVVDRQGDGLSFRRREAAAAAPVA